MSEESVREAPFPERNEEGAGRPAGRNEGLVGSRAVDGIVEAG